MSPAYLFVYGTLQRGSRNRFAGLLESQSRFLGAARTRGRLYSLGKYPGAISFPASAEWIHGEVFLLKQPAKILRMLDSYEGPKFERAAAPVELASGRQIDAWAYFYRSEPSTGRVRSGRWAKRDS